jgi:hypothetical protein
MEANLGKVDRILRALLGFVLILMGLIYNSWLILIGGIIFLTSVFSWCPIYYPFRWSTKKKKLEPKEK